MRVSCAAISSRLRQAEQFAASYRPRSIPSGDRKVDRFGWTFAPGDKVMQIENDYDKEVYNGDIGYIDDVHLNGGEIVASFDGRSVTYEFGELDMLVPAYATSEHSSHFGNKSRQPSWIAGPADRRPFHS
jgi:ATP-dependent exoDNAse (exonuclease V) alpha subunit